MRNCENVKNRYIDLNFFKYTVIHIFRILERSFFIISYFSLAAYLHNMILFMGGNVAIVHNLHV